MLESSDPHIPFLPQSAFQAPPKRLNLFWRMAFFWLGTVLILLLYLALGNLAIASHNTILVYAAMTVIYPGLVLGQTALFRRFVDRRSWRSLGLNLSRKSLVNFLQGIGFALLLYGLVYGTLIALGQVKVVALQANTTILAGLLFSLLTAFISEPLIEEPSYRGYVYRNLNSHLPCWLAIILQSLMFTSSYVCATIISAWLGLKGAGPAGNLATYIPDMLLFGSLMQILCIAKNNLYMNMGFHIFSIEIGRTYLVSTSSLALLRLALAPELFLIAKFTVLILGIVLFVLWQSLRGHPIDWQARIADEPEAEDHKFKSNTYRV
ncbi:CPBP family intramembrane metalloprotease [Ktedonosporobacter rubrisoli]|uniref:CPBP family intramembrane metalloprotease n=1 Tax=Ktedonosporobacter rubrisoli TaxID=2509675 RepID=A0A4P6JN47_KTERU|nr:type II CAAX endopeptidase family protein [Ktedonosporobacter rubrisoli]QBD76718.1 CPBP family intramembrane metalloprotease [Ktedonosporobacter rubrisoli]